MKQEHDAAARPRWYFYQDHSGSWRWDAVGANGRIVAQSAAAFASRAQSVLDARAHGHQAALLDSETQSSV